MLPHLVRQLLRYGVTAGGVAALYLAVYAALLAFGLHYFIAILISQVVAILVAFPLYRHFVFASRGTLRGDFVRFLAVWTGGAIAGMVATPLLVELLGWHPLVAQVVAIFVVSIASFLGHRMFAFRRRWVESSASTPAKDGVSP